MADSSSNQRSRPTIDVNDRQIGGTHYRSDIQHWDWVASTTNFTTGLDYFQGQITKYVARWKNKNGIEDLGKAAHFLEKYIFEATGQEKTMWQILEELNAHGKVIEPTNNSNTLDLKGFLQSGRTEHPHPFGYQKEEDNG